MGKYTWTLRPRALSSCFLINEMLVGQLHVLLWGGFDVTVWLSPWVLGFSQLLCWVMGLSAQGLCLCRTKN